MANDSGGSDDETNKIVRLPEEPPQRSKVALSLDERTLKKFRVGEPGWQERINDALREHLEDDSDLNDDSKT